MAKISRAALFDVLNSYEVPGAHQSLVALKAVKGIELEGDSATIHITLAEGFRDRETRIRSELEALFLEIGAQVDLAFEWQPTPQAEFNNLLRGVKRCIVVGSGKGGVGKSTVAANLACALSTQGLKTGLLDADIYGPSMAMMFGVTEGPEGTPDGKIHPIEKFGLKLMSMGFLIDEDRPVIWRGPMLNKALQQFLGDVLWGDLDVLVIDLPPGTGDTQISLIQNAQVDGAVVVSTPQDVAFLDAKKAIGLFDVVKVPIIGVIENMSSFICPHCKGETQIFGHGGVRAAAQKMDLPFLGEVPIDLELRAGGDQGTPLVISHPDSPQSKVFGEMASALKTRLGF